MTTARDPRAFVRRYLERFADTWTDASPVEDVRFVVLDSETTGADARRDSLISIGAVAVRNGEILLEDSFEALLRIAYNASAVTVHGITRDEAADGLEEPEALEAFIEYLGDGVITGHHIGFDIAVFNRALQRQFGFELRNRHLDTMTLTLQLERDGAFGAEEGTRGFSLDELGARFHIVPHDRHTAPGDAFITAQILLRLLRLARRQGRKTLGRLGEPLASER